MIFKKEIYQNYLESRQNKARGMTLIRMILQQVIFIALSSRVNVTGWHRQLS